MFDLKWIRECPEDFDRGLRAAAWSPCPPGDRAGTGSQAPRETVTALQEMQARRNEASKAIGLAKREGRTRPT